MRELFGTETLRAAIAEVFPGLAGGRFTLLTEGWDSIAVDVDDAHIFKFPRHAAGEAGLLREVRLLAAVRPAVSMKLPDPTLHTKGRVFSHHAKLKGDHLLAAQYDGLPDARRAHLAADMALFFAEVHRIDPQTMREAGAREVGVWVAPDEVERDIAPVLPIRLRDFAARTLEAWAALTPDPLGSTFGYFDGHGWNMAFDHAHGRLNGLYDLADSGFGDLHREFVYPGFVARDLTRRIAVAYEDLTGRRIDRRRVDTMTAYLRLVELAGVADDPARLPAITGHLERWASGL